MFAEIITVGDELLIGQVVDTNSAWMGQELNKIGVKVKQITSVSDEAPAIAGALDNALKRAHIVLMTGGLGPTRDDVTKNTLANYFGSEMYFDEKAYANVEAIFTKRNLPMLESNRQQAMLPVKCRPLYNPNGTAPGMLFEHDGRMVVSMPGVPSEMKAIMEAYVFQEIRSRYKLPVILHKTVLTTGIGESFLAEKIKDLEDSLPKHISLAYLPDLNLVRLRFTGTGQDKIAMKDEINYLMEELRRLVGGYIVSEDGRNIQEVVGEMLAARRMKVGTVESCTGGFMSHLITSVPGSSAYYEGSVVAYAYELKDKLVGVDMDLINREGAVSQACVSEMAKHGRDILGVDYCIATSGIAGPGGGTPEKPVGTVWIAVAGPQGVYLVKFLFTGTRPQVIQRSAIAGLDLLRKVMLNLVKVD